MSERLQPTSLTVEHMSRLLTMVGGRPVSEEMVRKDIDAGAPVNPDGTVNLVHYAAWLVKKEAARGD